MLLFFISVFVIWIKQGYAVDKNELLGTIKHFGQVDENLYRGGQPSDEDLTLLKDYGIKKIINCRAEEDLVEAERKQVESLGMEYVHIPWTIFSPYNPDVIEIFFLTIQNKNEKPVFFHCKRGSERTGVLAAVYKIKMDGLSAQEAFDDAKKYNVKLIWRPFVKAKIRTFEKELHNE